MNRHGAESRGYNDSPNGNMTDGNEFDGSTLNRSINSKSSYVSINHASASSSKAVLAALRALQDKIKRLESERAQALDETVQLRHRIKNQEIESNHTKQKDNLAAQKSSHEIRSAYERILTEKTETEIRLAKLEERNREEQQIIADLRSRISATESDKNSAVLEIKNLVGEKNQLLSQIQEIQQKEKDLSQLLLWESKRHEDYSDDLNSKLSALNNDFKVIAHEKTVVETKLTELNRLVGQLLSVNESLVTRLSGKPINPKTVSSKIVTATKKKKSAASSQQKALTPTRVVVSTQPAAFDHVRNLHGTHKMYVKLAQSIVDTKSLISTKKTRSPASEGQLISNQAKPSTLLKSRKTQLNETRSDRESNLSSSYDVRIPSIPSEYRHLSLNDEFGANEGNSFTNISSSNREFKGYHNVDIEDVILSLEEEFSALNNQYRSLLSSAQSVSNTSAGNTEADDLVTVIQKLRRKGEQLRALKSPPRG